LLIELARLDIQCVLCFALAGTNCDGDIAVKALEERDVSVSDAIFIAPVTVPKCFDALSIIFVGESFVCAV